MLYACESIPHFKYMAPQENPAGAFFISLTIFLKTERIYHALNDQPKKHFPGSRNMISTAVRNFWDSLLSQNPFDDLPAHIGEPELTALVAEGQTLVVDAQDVEVQTSTS